VAKYIYAAILGLIGAVIIHIIMLFLIPHWTGQLLWDRLRQDIPPYQFTVLPAGNPIAQRADPLLPIRVCRFDLSENPIHLTAAGNAPFWSLSIYSEKGDNLYSISSSSAPDGILDIFAMDPQEVMDFKHNLPDDDADSVILGLNAGRNFAVLRVLSPSPDWNQAAAAFWASAQCRPLKD